MTAAERARRETLLDRVVGRRPLALLAALERSPRWLSRVRTQGYIQDTGDAQRFVRYAHGVGVACTLEDISRPVDD